MLFIWLEFSFLEDEVCYSYITTSFCFLFFFSDKGATYCVAITVATPRLRYDGWIKTLKATHGGKEKLFLDVWKEEDLYRNFPELHPGCVQNKSASHEQRFLMGF
jgi:hypothetical protein